VQPVEPRLHYSKYSLIYQFIHFASFYDLLFRNCFDSVVFFMFLFLSFIAFIVAYHALLNYSHVRLLFIFFS